MGITQSNISLEEQRRQARLQRIGLSSTRRKLPRWRYSWIGYLIALPSVALTSGITLALQAIMQSFPGIPMFLCLFIVMWIWGIGPALVVLTTGFFCLEYLFLNSSKGLLAFQWPDLLPILLNVVCGLVMIILMQWREQRYQRLQVTEENLQAYADELESINQKLDAANQLKDRFLSIASHEFKTPVTAIRGQAQLGLRRLSKQKGMVTEVEVAAEPLKRINEQTARLMTLIDELLNVSNMRSGKTELNLQYCDLVSLCRDVVEDQRMITGRQIEFNQPIGSVIGLADPDHLAQVIINLVTNAIKYSAEDKPVEVMVGSQGDNALIYVRDYGVGIAPEQVNHIFELFYRTPDVQTSETQGLGLGLSIVKDIVERHHGKVWVESQPGHGSTFFVQIPLSQEPVKET